MKDNKNMKEKISALADSELSDFETRRILEEIESVSYTHLRAHET